MRVPAKCKFLNHNRHNKMCLSSLNYQLLKEKCRNLNSQIQLAKFVLLESIISLVKLCNLTNLLIIKN
jgi:hypothetical protein